MIIDTIDSFRSHAVTKDTEGCVRLVWLGGVREYSKQQRGDTTKDSIRDIITFATISCLSCPTELKSFSLFVIFHVIKPKVES